MAIGEVVGNLNNRENKKNNNECYLVFQTFKMKNDEVVKSYLNFVNTNNISWDINIKDENNDYPLLCLINNNNAECFKLLIDYVNAHDITLNITDKNKEGNYPLLGALDSSEKVKLLIEYADAHNITLNITDKNNNGDYPLLAAVKCNSENVKILMDYADAHNIDLNIKDKNNDENYPLLAAASSNDEAIKLLIEYANAHDITLNITDKSNDGNYPLLAAANNDEAVRLLIEYAVAHDITLNLTDKDNDGNYPILAAATNNGEVTKLLIEYANTHDITLNITDKNNDGDYPLLAAVNCNSENVKTLMDYANAHDIILNINDKNKKDQYPISVAVKYRNVVTNMLLIEYANDHSIILNIDNKDKEVNNILINGYYSSLYIKECYSKDKIVFLSSEKFELVANNDKTYVLKLSYNENIVNFEIEEKNSCPLREYSLSQDLTELVKIDNFFLLFEKTEEVFNSFKNLNSEKNLSLVEENGQMKIKIINFVNNKTIYITIPPKMKGINDEEIKNLYSYINKLEEKVKDLEGRISSIENKNYALINCFKNSNIVKKSEVDLIIDWIGVKPKGFELLLDSKVDGDSTNTFYEKCGNISPTITFVKSEEGCRFGGFTNEIWPTKGFKKDPLSFVFSLDKRRKYRILKEKKAIYWKKNYGFCFGNNSLFIYDKSTETSKNITKDLKSHEFPQRKNDLNNGKSNFKVSSYEVYQIII